MAYQHIELHSEPIARLVLNRPDRRNALSLALMLEVVDALDAVAANPDVRVVIIEGAGAAFSAGHDLAEMTATRDESFYQELFSVCVRMMTRLHEVPQPVIAKVHGVATAAGCQLVAACDLAVAADDARFATPGVNIGLFCSTPMVPVQRAIGRKRALEMLLTGNEIDAATAAEWGLVNRVVPAAALVAETEALARAASRGSAYSKGVGKQSFYAQIDLDQAHAYAYASEVMAMMALTQDGREAMAAFVEKRKARFS
jgi:enoyl-CoA hydratase/carnithine racemase